MTRTACQTRLLRLHTDDCGYVWYGDDDQLAANSYHAAPDFDVTSLGVYQVERIKVLGTRANAALIVSLYQKLVAPQGAGRVQVFLGAPSVVPTEGQRHDPEVVLHALWQPTAAAGLGGYWHLLRAEDYPTYAMCVADQGGARAGPVPELVARIAAYHPAWPALSFVPGVDVDAGCRLLMEVVDPRWFRHPFHPNRDTRLCSHLGLRPDNVRACLGHGDPGHRYHQAALTVACWYNPASLKRYHSGGVDSCIWQAWAARGDPVKALLAGTRKLLNLVQAVWLGSRSAHPEVRFDPHLFFRNALEAFAYEAHVAGRKGAGLKGSEVVE